MVTVKDILADSKRLNKALMVDNLPVWDYKVLNNELHLIWEPVPGSQDSELIKWKEIEKYLKSQESEVVDLENLEIVPETGGTSFKGVNSTASQLNFKI